LGYDYYIVTKIDETMTLGSVIEACYKDNRSIVYLTNGQSVPEDILVPDIDRIIEYLKDLN
jgi:flagellar biosynthesis protein FlhF